MTDALAAWLRAELDADEQWADYLPTDADYERCAVTGSLSVNRMRALRVVTETTDVAAVRRQIGNHAADPNGCCRTCAHWVTDWVDGFKTRLAYEGVRAPCLSLRLLALPYTGRPGFREEWRP